MEISAEALRDYLVEKVQCADLEGEKLWEAASSREDWQATARMTLLDAYGILVEQDAIPLPEDRMGPLLLLRGRLAFALGDFEQTLEFVSELEDWAATHPQPPPLGFSAKLLQRLAERSLGQLQTARAGFKELVVAEALLGLNTDPSRLATSFWALTLGDLGLTAEALDLQRQVFEHRRETLGETDPETLTAMGSLALSLSDLGRVTEALDLQRQALDLARQREDALGEEQPETLVALGNLALSLIRLDRHPEVLELQEEILERTQRVVNEEHPATLAAMTDLASTLIHLGNDAAAIELQKQVLERRQRASFEDRGED